MMAHLADMNAGTSVIDDTFTLADPADNTKKFRMDGVGITTGNTRVLTVQDSDLTVAGIDVAQEFSKTQNFNATTLTDAATIAWDAAQNQVTSVTLDGNRTFGAPTNQVDGAVYVLTIIQDATTGGRTASFNAVFKFAGGSAPTLSTATSAKDVLVFLSDGTNMQEIGRSLNIS
jgi:DNA-binding NarL/FixJ family response regulator